MNKVTEKYINGYGLDAICKEFHIGKLKAKSIIISDGVEIRPKSSFKKYSNVDKTPIFQEVDGYVRKAVSKDGKFSSYDYLNKSGKLSEYVTKTLGITIPSSYVRRRIAKETGKFWYEDYFDIVLERKENVETKKCPYCDWETIDTENKSGAFEQHLKNRHDISRNDYLKQFPEENQYFITKNTNRNLEIESDKTKYVECPICHKRFKWLNKRHLESHNITKEEIINKFNSNIISNDIYEKMISVAEKMNYANESKQDKFSSKSELEIFNFIKNDLHINCRKDRRILNGEELDIFIPEKNIAIEFNGNKWHTEFFGKKDKNYHISKTLKCKLNNISLIHIFEDEYVNNKKLVLEKIKHILKKDYNLEKIPGRKCIITEIEKELAFNFLEKYHIQGYASSTKYLGAFYNNKLIAVMTFKNILNNSSKWELNRFASDYNYIMQGVGGKLFSYFVKIYNPSEIKSFLDRKWCFDENSNIYTKLNFSFDSYIEPDYKYFNEKINRYKRFHKFNFRKQILHKKFGLPIKMTELEMARKLGYDRIWDCGLIKYVWKNKKAQEKS